MKKSLLVILGTLFSLSLGACNGTGDSRESVSPSFNPSVEPSVEPSANPSVEPSVTPSIAPSVNPSVEPSIHPSEDIPSECGCDRVSGAPGDEVYLEVDERPNYEYDEVSNADGSMGYEIFVRTFYDSDGDGDGDLNGVKLKLPYLASLGVKTLWLMPIHPSHSYHGYDITDYYGIHPDFGTLDDFDALVTEADKYNIDIMIDMVFNHTSKYHPWFSQSYQDYFKEDYEGSKKDWYNWSDKSKGSYYPYSASGKETKYYEARFVDSMPDLNLKSQAVMDEIENITKFWIQHGVAGFRLDAVRYYYYNNVNKNVEFLTWLEETAHKYDPNFYMVGEDWESGNIVAKYHASKCDSFFNFDASMQYTSGGDIWACFNNTIYRKTNKNFANNWAEATQKYETKVKEANPDAYVTYFITNHDGDRASKYFSGCNYKSVVSLMGLLPGMSFMYYGEEIEMLGSRVTSPDDRSDVRRRLPMVWSKEDKTGECVFPEKDRQDLNNNPQVENGVDDMLQVPYSLINHYKKVINVRNKYPFIKHGTFENLTLSLEREDNSFLVAYKIALGEDYIIVVHNFNPYNVEVTALGDEILDEINTSQRKPYLREGKLGIGPYSTVVLH